MHTRAMQVKTCQCLNPRRRPSATIRIESACGVATDWVTCGFLNPKRENVNGTWRLMYSREVSINRFTKREWVTYFAEGEVKVQPLIAWLHGDPTALDVEVRHTVGKGLSCKHAPQRVTKCMVLDFWRKGTFVLLLFCFWNQWQNWNSKTCLVTNEWKILRNQIGWVKLVETYKSRLLKLLLLIIVWLWSPLLGWITINCSPDQFSILHLIRRTLYHLHQKADLSTSINISFEKIY